MTLSQIAIDVHTHCHRFYPQLSPAQVQAAIAAAESLGSAQAGFLCAAEDAKAMAEIQQLSEQRRTA